MRCVIAADVMRPGGVPIQLSGIAAKFEPHVTLWGRFEPVRDRGWDAFTKEATELVEDLTFPDLRLMGPRHVGEDMVWYESDPGADGFDALRSAHDILGRRLRECGLIEDDLLPAEFRGVGYRPHLTAAWAGPSASSKPEHPLWVRVSALSIYSYATLPSDGPVARCQLRAIAY